MAAFQVMRVDSFDPLETDRTVVSYKESNISRDVAERCIRKAMSQFHDDSGFYWTANDLEYRSYNYILQTDLHVYYVWLT